MRLELFTVVALLASAGCFEEPKSADKVVPEGARVYLTSKGLKDLSDQADAFKLGDKIDYVNLDRNQLETFPGELASLTGLKWLRLNDNRLSALPDLSALKNLRRIYLRGNRFESVPETLKDLPSLTDVDLSSNPVKEIPSWLAEKKGLEALSFSRTLVEKLPDDLSAWKSLKQLQLGDLKLSLEEMSRIRKALPGTAVVF
jgi:Leucine-rich repeat (LRR) protein